MILDEIAKTMATPTTTITTSTPTTSPWTPASQAVITTITNDVNALRHDNDRLSSAITNYKTSSSPSPPIVLAKVEKKQGKVPTPSKSQIIAQQQGKVPTPSKSQIIAQQQQVADMAQLTQKNPKPIVVSKFETDLIEMKRQYQENEEARKALFEQEEAKRIQKNKDDEETYIQQTAFNAQKAIERNAKFAELSAKYDAKQKERNPKFAELSAKYDAKQKERKDDALSSLDLQLGQQQHVSAKSTEGQQLSNLLFSSGEPGETVVITRDPSGYGISVALGLDEPVPAPPVVHKQAGPKEHGDGRSISMTDNERKLFINQFKTYIKKNNKIKTMKQYIKYIMKHQNEFMNKTVNRAETYSTM